MYEMRFVVSSQLQYIFYPCLWYSSPSGGSKTAKARSRSLYRTE